LARSRTGLAVDVCPGVFTFGAIACWWLLLCRGVAGPLARSRTGLAVDVCPGVSTFGTIACWWLLLCRGVAGPLARSRTGLAVDVCLGVSTFGAIACWWLLLCHVMLCGVDTWLTHCCPAPCLVFCCCRSPLLPWHRCSSSAAWELQGKRMLSTHANSARHIRWVTPLVCVLRVGAHACFCGVATINASACWLGMLMCVLGSPPSTQARAGWQLHFRVMSALDTWLTLFCPASCFVCFWCCCPSLLDTGPPQSKDNGMHATACHTQPAPNKSGGFHHQSVCSRSLHLHAFVSG
jgi:hypothetical protein